eukprot:TRINITY_DN19060_c0_g1_i1.p1 TRINITY_DN19060_c0_g1~~TRINITY_DN19060_c0_g1_i1.p1  ORF type:complete len:423 (+),score=71.14 TRINITY_DN19060_c0_g1_i1:46-1314(+)
MSVSSTVWRDVAFAPIENLTPLCWHWRKNGKCETADCKFAHADQIEQKKRINDENNNKFGFMIVKQKPTQRTDGKDYNQTQLLEDTLENGGGGAVTTNPNLLWMTSTKYPSKNVIPNVTFVNRFCLKRPSAARITQKASLVQTLRKSKIDFHMFVPETYLLPQDIDVFVSRYHKATTKIRKIEDIQWICKPSRSGGGKGITLLKATPTESELENTFKSAIIMSRYVASPLLIEGRKVDIRFYCILTGIGPESNVDLWLHDEALVRHAIHKYDPSSTDPGCFLTFIGGVNETDHRFARRSNSSWRSFLESLPDDVESRLCTRINEALLMMFKAGYDDIPQRLSLQKDRQFELFGVDVLLDDSFNPWILEVNSNPDLTASTPAGGRVFKTEQSVKSAVVSDMLNLINSLGSVTGGWRPVIHATS